MKVNVSFEVAFNFCLSSTANSLVFLCLILSERSTRRWSHDHPLDSSIFFKISSSTLTIVM